MPFPSGVPACLSVRLGCVLEAGTQPGGFSRSSAVCSEAILSPPNRLCTFADQPSAHLSAFNWLQVLKGERFKEESSRFLALPPAARGPFLTLSDERPPWAPGLCSRIFPPASPWECVPSVPCPSSAFTSLLRLSRGWSVPCFLSSLKETMCLPNE